MRGEPHFTLSQVALNDVIMVFAFAPIVALLLGLSAITVPWDTLFLSVLLYIVVPLIIASLWRRSLLDRENGQVQLEQTIARLGPFSLGALLATLILLFGFPGKTDHWCTDDNRDAGSANPDSGLLQFRTGIFAQSAGPIAALRGWPVCTHRRQQFLRTGGRHGNCTFRIRVRCGAGDSSRRTHRGSGDAGSCARR